MLEMVDVVAGIGWDPEIRGFLSVLVGVIVLCGSVWLLLATNSGARQASLLALSGFFGWMVIMGAIWWIYGIGYEGDAPSWQLVEIIATTEETGDLGASSVEAATRLQTEDLPTGYEVVVEYGDEVALAEYGPVTAESLPADATEGLTDDEIDELVADRQARNEAVTLSEVAAVSPGTIDRAIESGFLDKDGWELLSVADAGEAQASATAFLLDSGDFDFEAQTDFKLLDAFTTGGKPSLPDDPSRWDRIANTITSTARITHPTRYGIVQVQAVIPQETLPGQPPPRPVVDPREPVVSVIMVRDLGNERLLPALVTVGSGLIFAALAYMLHVRDKELMARRAAFEAETK